MNQSHRSVSFHKHSAAPMIALTIALTIALRTTLLITLSVSPYGLAASLQVTDYRGANIRLEKPAQRIIALAPHIVENLFSAGLGDRIVGTVEHSDYPEAAQALPRIGSATTYNLEKILALQPDLVIQWLSGSHITVTQQLERLKLPVYVDDPSTENDIMRSVRDFATLGGTTPFAQNAIKQFQHDMKTIPRPEHPRLEVFYQVWANPLMTVNGNHIISRILERCGGHNVFAALPARAPIVSLEALIKANPDVILIEAQATPSAIQAYPWSHITLLKAVSAQRIVKIDRNILVRPTFRIAEGTQRVCTQLRRTALQ
ncbi:MAG: cobalamin-binding protein [Gammaproteobacteria bacterium]